MHFLEKKLGVFLIINLIMIGCSSENGGNITGNDDALVKVTIAFMGGFEKEVKVIFNDDLIFWAFISGEASFSGPQAEFTTYLPKGKNTLDITWRFSGHLKKQTIEFVFWDAEEFFIGLTFLHETEKLRVMFKEGHPGYL